MRMHKGYQPLQTDLGLLRVVKRGRGHLQADLPQAAAGETGHVGAIRLRAPCSAGKGQDLQIRRIRSRMSIPCCM